MGARLQTENRASKIDNLSRGIRARGVLGVNYTRVLHWRYPVALVLV